MPKIIHSKLSRQDLLLIWRYIAEDNKNAADKLLDNIKKHCEMICENPKLGQARPDISIEMRHFPVKNYLILYREYELGIEIVRVIHGSRNLKKIFI